MIGWYCYWLKILLNMVDLPDFVGWLMSNHSWAPLCKKKSWWRWPWRMKWKNILMLSIARLIMIDWWKNGIAVAKKRWYIRPMAHWRHEFPLIPRNIEGKTRFVHNYPK
jgi:hypothetical protein